MNNLLSLLEAMKYEKCNNLDEFITDSDKQMIYNWFNKYSNSVYYSIESIIQLLFYLYLHENLDFYTVEEYQKVADFLSQKYKINKVDFLDMYMEFKLLLYNN